MRTAGVDGCRDGWVVALLERDQPLGVSHQRTFAGVLRATEGCSVIGVDMPIGLPEFGGSDGRLCDRLAHQRLRPSRGGSFACPARELLGADDERAAGDLNAAFSEGGRKVSNQSWDVRAKIREVDAVMTPECQQRVVEVHPELSFQEMNDGRPLSRPKASAAGLFLRMRLLSDVVGVGHQDLERAAATLSGAVILDDLLDAVAAAWSARRVAEGKASRLPESPPVDARGLRMEICA